MEARRAGVQLVKLWPWLAAAASGFLITLSLPPFDQIWTCWIALTPLLAAVWFSGETARRRGGRDLLLGYVAGVVFFWSAFSWLHTVTVLGLILVGLYMAIYFALFAWLAGIVRPRKLLPTTRGAPNSLASGKPAPPRQFAWQRSLPNEWPQRPNEAASEEHSPWLSSLGNLFLAAILASAWTALEWLRGWLFSGWGWNGLGVALHGVLPLIQIAEFTGVAGLSFVVAFVNVVIVATARRFVAETKVLKRRPHFEFTLTMAGLVGLCAYGLGVLKNPPPTKPLRVAAVQSNVPREEKFSEQFQGKTFDEFNDLTNKAKSAKPPVDLVMWPESSMPGPVLQDASDYRFVMSVAAAMKSDLLLGSIDEDAKGAYNAALLVPGGGGKAQVYRKLHLVPFGEYVPGRNIVPFVAQIVGDQVPADFARGTEATVFRLTNGVKVAPLICFEDTLGELTRQFVLRGAEMFANVTNDGWFLVSAGSEQHLDNAIFRCVEARRPLARAANTGVTCFVDPFGRITQRLVDAHGGTFTKGVLIGAVQLPIAPQMTFYTRHGELFAELCGCVALFYLVVRLPQLVRRRKPLS